MQASGFRAACPTRNGDAWQPSNAGTGFACSSSTGHVSRRSWTGSTPCATSCAQRDVMRPEVGDILILQTDDLDAVPGLRP